MQDEQGNKIRGLTAEWERERESECTLDKEFDFHSD